MKDVSYEILDLFETYGSDPEGIRRALAAEKRPEYLYALSDIRQNLLEWYPFDGTEQVLEIGSGYGALTGLLAKRAAHVTVLDESDENLEVNRRRNGGCANISYGLEEPSRRFDLVVICGVKKGTSAPAAVERGSSFLAEDGALILACENSLGLRYLAGGSHWEDQADFTRSQVLGAFEGRGFKEVEFYYPTPDYRLAVSIYSDRYLPGKGELADGTAYDEPRYSCVNQEAVFDLLEQEGDFGRFSNSFLVAASKKAWDRRTIFVKYNRTRREAFAIRTSIGEENGRRYVEKTALDDAGSWHILSFEKKYAQLQGLCPNIHILKPEMGGDGRSVRFEFLAGVTLAEKLGRQISEGRAPVEAIREAMDLVFDVPEDQTGPFKVTPEFTEVFGTVPELSDRAYRASNIDGLFENLMEVDGRVYCLDYEWVFDFPVPEGFVRYRNLAYFYYKYQRQMVYGSLEEFLGEFGVSRELAGVYGAMEQAFQAYVHGDGNQGYLANYQQKVTTLEELKAADGELSRARERINQLQAEVEEKNQQIRKEQEVQRLTNNHVANLEVMIKDLRHEIDELGKLATYLNGHEALVFKARRKLGAQVNKAFPKGTRKRKVLNYCFNTVKHPCRYGKLYLTSEGRRQIDGDFKIGEDYLKYGRV